MTNSELSNEFDVLYNSITSNQAPGIDEYEKSVFLTNAQYDVIKGYASPKGNKVMEGIDMSRKRQADFSNLITTVQLTSIDVDSKFDSRSICYRTPSDLFIPINEACNDKDNRYVIVPISYSEYDTLMIKPYQLPIKRHLWRLFTNSLKAETVNKEVSIGDTVDTVIMHNNSDKFVTLDVSSGEESVPPTIDIKGTSVTIKCIIKGDTEEYANTYLNENSKDFNNELIKYIGRIKFPKFNASPSKENMFSISSSPATPIIELIGKADKETLTYTMRYIRKAKPIILEDLTGSNLSIDGVQTYSECELDPELHREILQRAVELAKAVYMGDLNSQLALGGASKTDLGYSSQPTSKD